ncbi:MAG: oxidoreductase domain-containing protein [Limisphaerales bacterium]|nr:MAG: oxidoreductase domain-containing protein [Limisphaerales bacterium]TXT47038.1 MAG: oxidoreductase domain-containing protein [Limisphaerales bacterium]
MNTSPATRRDFVKTSAVAGGALATAVHFPHVANAAAAGDKIKIGWVGCGGRGTGAANQALNADSNLVMWSMGDVFQDKIDSGLASLKEVQSKNPEKVNVSKERQFTGIDAFQKVLNSGVDVVLLTTSPGFRPQHIRAAIEAGKHVFAEKPMAVDGPGVRSVMESIKLAKQKNLALVDGFVWRWTTANRDAFAKIHDGAVGDIRAIYTSYYSGAVDRYPKWNRTNTKTDLEWQIRRWYYFTWLSGDHIVEQAVHSVDKLLWAMKDEPPESVICTGGRQVRPGGDGGEYGNIYDHFAAEYKWAGGVKGYHFCRQFDRCHGAVTEQVFGTKGVYEGESGGKRHVITGENRWRWTGDKTQNGYQTEHDEMYASIRAGKPLNTGDRFIKTTLTAIMARMAAYTGKEITWEMALNSKEDLFPKNMTWDMKLPVAPVAKPGQTQFS